MDRYDETSYGDAFADVYDEWYADVSDIDATVETLIGLAEGGRVLELGVGTGRLAVPLATEGSRHGVTVTGIDTSSAMLDRLTERDVDGLVTGLIGNMAGPLPVGPFDLVVVAYNTLFNLTEARAQAECFAAVGAALRARGRFVVEAYVPPAPAGPDTDVSVRSMTADRVVLSVSMRDPDRQIAEGQFVELTESGGVRLRPWSIRYASVTELDDMARAAGFAVEHRWESFAREPFGAGSERHVTVFRLC